MQKLQKAIDIEAKILAEESELERLREKLAKLEGGFSQHSLFGIGLSDVKYPKNKSECQALISKLLDN